MINQINVKTAERKAWRSVFQEVVGAHRAPSHILTVEAVVGFLHVHARDQDDPYIVLLFGRGVTGGC